MSAEKVTSRRDPDGNVEVWLDGWHVVFPASGEQPTAKRADPPASPPEKAVDAVTVSPFGEGRAVRCGSWIVSVTDRGFKVIPTAPKNGDSDDDSHHYYLYRL